MKLRFWYLFDVRNKINPDKNEFLEIYILFRVSKIDSIACLAYTILIQDFAINYDVHCFVYDYDA